ncbi:MAG: radical SAM protein [Nanoarchaeota archaeon]|mgnify:CR=1 FL=1
MNSNTNKKVLFIIPNIVGDKGAATAPLPGVAYIAGSARTAGYAVGVIDMRVEPNDIFERISSFAPDLIGISFMSMEFSHVFDFVNSLKIKFPSIPLIMGGAGGSTLGIQVLKATTAEYVLTREGERAIVELLSGKDISQISSLIWKNERGEIVENPQRPFELNLDELAFPAYDLFPMEQYVDSKIPIVTSRGCPYLCTFCANKAAQGAPWRPRTPENILKEISFWHEKGFRQFHFVDDNFTLNMQRAEKICDMIITSGMKIRWDLRNGIRADKISEQLLAKMKQAGCFYFALGIESIDQEVLDKMKKNLKAEEVFEAVRIARKAGIPFGGFFIIGLLGDTYAKFLKCYDFAKHAGFSEVRFYNPIPFPSTELYAELVERNLLLSSPEEYLNMNSKTFGEDPIFATPEFSAEERKKAIRLGQKLVMQKLLTKEFGNIAGTAAALLWQMKPLQAALKGPGLQAWRVLRKYKKRKAMQAVVRNR